MQLGTSDPFSLARLLLQRVKQVSHFALPYVRSNNYYCTHIELCSELAPNSPRADTGYDQYWVEFGAS